MDNSLIIQGRPIGPDELAQVRGLLAAHPDWSRYRLSRELCRVWNWRSLTGQIKDMAARALLLKLEEQGWWRCLRAGAIRPTGCGTSKSGSSSTRPIRSLAL